MALTAAELARLRRMCGELTDAAGYTDGVLQEMAARYPLPDAEHRDPDDVGWMPGYDLAAAAADVWAEKAASLAVNYDFSADGGDYKRSQAHAQALSQAAYWRSRRKALPRRLAARLRGDVSGVIDGDRECA
jgi:hypothetical protein